MTADNVNKDNSSAKKLSSYISELEQNNQPKIRVEDLFIVIRERKIHWKGISYSSWKKFYQGKALPKYAFDAYCYALKINPDEYREIKYPEAYRNLSLKSRKKEILVKILSNFNHQEQIQIFKNSWNDNKLVFLIKNPCLYSRTWMLKCLENYILTNYHWVSSCEYFPENTSSQYLNTEVAHWCEQFKKKYLKSSKSVKRTLKKGHLFIIINAENYDLQTLEDLITRFWKQLVLKEVKTEEACGKLIMFLLSRDNKNNDWEDGQWKNHNILAETIVELEPANPFRKEHIQQLEEVIEKCRLNNILSRQCSERENPETVAEDLISNSQSTEQLLIDIYAHFKVQRDDFAPTWQIYP